MAEAQRRVMSDFGAATMEITVLAQQAALLAWYERLGFRRTASGGRSPRTRSSPARCAMTCTSSC